MASAIVLWNIMETMFQFGAYGPKSLSKPEGSFVFKFRLNKMFKDWFQKTSTATIERPKLQCIRHNSTVFERSIKWNLINEWNLFMSDKKVMICIDMPDFNICDVIKEYLIRFRGSLFIYF